MQTSVDINDTCIEYADTVFTIMSHDGTQEFIYSVLPTYDHRESQHEVDLKW